MNVDHNIHRLETSQPPQVNSAAKKFVTLGSALMAFGTLFAASVQVITGHNKLGAITLIGGLFLTAAAYKAGVSLFQPSKRQIDVTIPDVDMIGRTQALNFMHPDNTKIGACLIGDDGTDHNGKLIQTELSDCLGYMKDLNVSTESRQATITAILQTKGNITILGPGNEALPPDNPISTFATKIKNCHHQNLSPSFWSPYLEKLNERFGVTDSIADTA